MSSHPDYGKEAVDVANAMAGVLAGKSTTAVYLAIGMTLGAMEMRARDPARSETFRLLGKVMDDYIKKSSN